MARSKTSSPEFDAWWQVAREKDEFRGVSMAAALAVWNAKNGQGGTLVADDAPPPLPEAFTKYWEHARHLDEFRGCTMPAAYAVWKAALESVTNVKPAKAMLEVETEKRKRRPVILPEVVEEVPHAEEA